MSRFTEEHMVALRAARDVVKEAAKLADQDGLDDVAGELMRSADHATAAIRDLEQAAAS